MRLLIVCQHYKPEPFNVHEVCEQLARRGHEVTVLTALPNYPEGKIQDDYRGGAHRDEVVNDVHIIRVPIVARGKDLHGLNKLRRITNYVSFPLSSWLTRAATDEVYDCVICFQYSPILMAMPALRIAKKQNIPCLIWSFDLWPEDMLTGGLSRKGFPYRMMRSVSRRIYGSAEMVAVTSPGFKKYFHDQLGLRDLATVCLPQFAEAMFEESNSQDSSLDKEATVFTFAGNVGGNQSVETIVNAAALLQEENQGEKIRIRIVGSGSRLDACRKLATRLGVNNLEFLGRRRLEEMPSLYADSDAMLLTLAKPSGDSLVPIYTIPRKFQSYLAAGKSVICSTDGEVGRITTDNGCGLTCPAENPEALAVAMRRFSSLSVSEREKMAEKARRLYAEQYSRNHFFMQFDEILDSLAAGKEKNDGNDRL